MITELAVGRLEELESSGSLAVLSRATRMLAEVQTIDDAKNLMDMASAAKHYARKHGLGKDAVAHARSIEIAAEIKLGEILVVMEKNKGAQGIGTSAVEQDDRTMPLTLKEIGVSKDLSSEAQMLASLPIPIQEKMRQGEKTIKEAKRELKEQKREGIRQENRELVEHTPPASVSTNGHRYQTIALDPPWDWGDEGDCDQYGRARPTYETMSIDEITALPVSRLAADNAHIYLWITNRSLPKGFALLEAWGFRYITTLTWVKPSIGMGNYFRGTTEQVLFGVRGSLPLLRHDAGTHFEAPRPGRHSEKPDAFYELVESCSPGPWLEMFSRKNRNGWKVWGAEVAATAVL